MKANIVEIFTSIQGEGYGIGIPCVFVRLWGCNLRCTFAGKECDTPYSVFGKDENSTEKSVIQVVNKIKTTGLKHIVWTGGEPMLQQNFIIAVMEYLNNKIGNFTCEVETNGTVKVDKKILKYVNWFNISAKLKGSNQMNEKFDKLRINHKALETYPKDKSFFKFVYTAKSDMIEILELQKKYDLPIYLMPEGISREAIVEHSQEVVDVCIKNGFRFSPREHIIIWNYMKGK